MFTNSRLTSTFLLLASKKEHTLFVSWTQTTVYLSAFWHHKRYPNKIFILEGKTQKSIVDRRPTAWTLTLRVSSLVSLNLRSRVFSISTKRLPQTIGKMFFKRNTSELIRGGKKKHWNLYEMISMDIYGYLWISETTWVFMISKFAIWEFQGASLVFQKTKMRVNSCPESTWYFAGTWNDLLIASFSHLGAENHKENYTWKNWSTKITWQKKHQLSSTFAKLLRHLLGQSGLLYGNSLEDRMGLLAEKSEKHSSNLQNLPDVDPSISFTWSTLLLMFLGTSCLQSSHPHFSPHHFSPTVSLVCCRRSCCVMSSFCNKTLEELFTVSIKACLVLSVAPVMLFTKLPMDTFCASTFCTTESWDESNLWSSTWQAFTWDRPTL